MDSTIRSRLSSITQQQVEGEATIKTQQALFNVYYQLYAIKYVEMPSEPLNVFKNISTKIENQLKNDLPNFKFFKQQQCKKTMQKQLNCIKKIQSEQSSMKKSKMLSSQQLKRRINGQIQNSIQFSPQKIKHQQFVQTVVKQKKQLDETADSRISIGDILDKLNEFDQQRTDIKFQIYAEDGSKMDKLYVKWADLHKKMKQVLQLYINKIGNGKTLLELYAQLDQLKNTNKVIQGFQEKQLLSKLDTYLQSLFLDQRQILLYRSSSQKSRSVYSSPGNYGYGSNIKKKLNYK